MGPLSQVERTLLEQNILDDTILIIEMSMCTNSHFTVSHDCISNIKQNACSLPHIKYNSCDMTMSDIAWIKIMLTLYTIIEECSSHT